ncbi:1-aminocyclopropane-1-carboxylate oxidase homolog isoform X2 [Zea mays]|uniref:Non-haem dioxygenase N-terminal domain-containing protein n=1 Tax=Zea mays TaxID=4577 RepID=A0A804RHQ4_MAIZE|nr:1-aminocyclopropane-1-carboxylate oxidase homolog isoform X2 [Zea mays]
MASTIGNNDRLTQLKAFDDTKAGVKGLVDEGVTIVPPIFHHLPDPHDATSNAHAAIPVIDLAAFSATNNDEAHAHQQLVAQVKAAAETVGFFQVVNHGVPAELLPRMLASVKSFNEEPADERRPYYTRDQARRVRGPRLCHTMQLRSSSLGFLVEIAVKEFYKHYLFILNNNTFASLMT